MTNVLSLDAFREKAQEEFADLVIPVDDTTNIKLLNPLRLSEEQRDEINSYFEDLADRRVEEALEQLEEVEEVEESTEDDGPTMFDIISAILIRVAETRDEGEYLIEAIGDDRPLLLVVFNEWSKRTQAGEA